MDEAKQDHRHFIPAMGQDRLLPVYDVLTRLVGVGAAHQYLLDRAAIGDNPDVLEIGCGTGNLLLRVGRKHRGATLTGLDPDPLALAGAKRKAVRRGLGVQLDQGFADELPYPDESFDRVLSALMYHHLEDDQKVAALREARRVLRPGGQLHLLDFAPDDRHRHRGRVAERAAGNSAESITTAIQNAGFTDAGQTGEIRLRLRQGRCLTFSGTR